MRLIEPIMSAVFTNYLQLCNVSADPALNLPNHISHLQPALGPFVLKE
jgi:hypothetical protein